MKLPIYLDNHATTQVDPRVVEEMLPCFTDFYGNPTSRSHSFGLEASKLVETGRGRVASLVGADPKEIVITSGATESNNLALKGIAQKGGHIISVATEHPSVLDSLKFLEGSGCQVTYLPVDRQGRIDLEGLKRSITVRTILISVMMANNEIGVIQPIEEIGRVAKEKGIIFHSDVTQAMGRIPVDLGKLNLDLASFSAHKMYGPKGVGALWVRRRNPPVRLAAQMHGGGHERGLRSGTLNVPGIVGFGKACDIARRELAGERARLETLRNRMLKGLSRRLEDIHVNGSLEHRLPGNLNVSFPGAAAESILLRVQGELAISTGAACHSARTEPSHVLKALGLSKDLGLSAVRFGLGRFNTEEEVDYAVEKIAQAVKHLREFSSIQSRRKKL